MIDLTADRHTHSSVTHGAASPAAMADAAVAAGLRTWGLSEHVRADTTWLPEYERLVRDLRRDELVIECGVEATIVDAAGHLDLPPGVAAVDYLLIADHAFPGVDGPVHPDEIRQRIRSGQLDADVAVEQVVIATCSAVLRSPRPPIVVHPFSLLPRLGLDESRLTEELLDELSRACLWADAWVEVDERWRCPSAEVTVALAARGVRICAGSDAHRPEDVGAWSYATEVLVAS